MRPPLRAVAVHIAVATALVATVGCVVQPAPNAGCEHGIGVIWSSEYDPITRVEFWDVGGRQGAASAEVQGAIPIIASTGGARGFASNGNVGHDKSAMTLIDRSRCSAVVHHLDEVGVLAATPIRDGVAAAYNGGGKWVDMYSGTGQKTATLDLGTRSPSTLMDSEHGLLVATTEFDRGATPPQGPIHLLMLAPDSRQLIGEVNISKALGLPPSEGSIHEMATIGDDAFLALTFVENQFITPPLFENRSTLTVVNLPTGKVSEIPLEKDMPYQVLAHKGKIYIAHTFLNPGIRPFDQYQFVSRVDPKTKQVETFDVGPNLHAIAFDRDQLYILHYDGVGPATLDVMDPTTMTRLATHNLPKPTGKHYYIAGIGLGKPPA